MWPLAPVMAGESAARGTAINADRLMAEHYFHNGDKDVRAEIEMAVDQLPSREREVVRRHCLEKESLVEVANGMGVSTSCVSQMHSRALMRLRWAVATAARQRPAGRLTRALEPASGRSEG